MFSPIGGIVIAFVVVACSCRETPKPPPQKTVPSAAKKKITPTKPPADREEKAFPRIGEVGILPLDVPDFAGLPLDRKTTVLTMKQAVLKTETVNFAMAGSRILRTRNVLAGILSAKDRVPPSIGKKIAPYAKRFFLNVGPIDPFTGERIPPGFIPGELAAAAKAALDSGLDLGMDDFAMADLGANRLEQLEALLADISVPIFGPRKNHDENDTEIEENTTSETASETNHLPALEEIGRSISKCTASSEERTEKDRCEALSGYLTAPSPETFSQFVDTFTAAALEVETFVGPIGPTHGADTPRRFQGLVAIQDRDQTPILQKLSELIPYFERRLPGNAMFIRRAKEIILPTVAAYHLVAAAPFGAVSRPGFRFPSPFGQKRGPSKVMLFTNVLDAEDRARKALLSTMLPKEGIFRARRAKWRRAADTAFYAMKYVIGFELGSRKALPRETMTWFSDTQGVLVEMHADLAAIHFAFDPALQALGLVPETECAVAILDGYLAGFLAEAPIETNSASPEGRAVIARRIIVRQLLKTDAVRVVKEDEEYIIKVTDAALLRKSIGELLAEAQKIISLNEEKSGELLANEYGGTLPKAWRDDIVERFEKSGIPVQWTYGYPMFIEKNDESGALKDVVLKQAVLP
ncbi:MAG: hypothetical protein PVH19_14590 [Planctomycetia bacterium]